MLSNSYFLLPMLTPSIISLAIFLLRGWALYSMCSNTGLHNAWTAWIPFAQDYCMGNLADRYSNSQGNQSKMRIWLVVLSAVNILCCFIVIGWSLSYLISIGLTEYIDEYELASFLMGIMGLLLLMAVIALTYVVLRLVVIYRIFKDFEPRRAGIYTLISFLGFDWICFIISRENVPVGIAGECSPLQPKYNMDNYSKNY